jgi:hypothetical protein
VREQRQHLCRRRFLVVPGSGVLAHYGGDQVEELPAAQRVVHDMRVLARPQRGGRPAQVLRHLVHLEHCAVAHVARDGRLAVADDVLAHHRAAAVGADQRRGLDALPAGRLDEDGRAVHLKAGDPGARSQLDAGGLAAVEQRAVDVGAVGDGVGIAEALGEALVERNVDHRLAGPAVHHQQPLDEHRFLLDQLTHPERVDGMPGIGRELDAGADLGELRRLLQHQHLEIAARKRQRRGEAAQAAAGDHHRLLIACAHARRLASAAPRNRAASAGRRAFR